MRSRLPTSKFGAYYKCAQTSCLGGLSSHLEGSTSRFGGLSSLPGGSTSRLEGLTSHHGGRNSHSRTSGLN